MESVGDSSRPRVYCRKCQEVVYCDTINYSVGTEFPPAAAERRLRSMHKQSGCDGKIEYMAGLSRGK